MSEFIPGNTYRDAVLIPGPSLFSRIIKKMKEHFSNWWGLWLVSIFLVPIISLVGVGLYSHSKKEAACHYHAIHFLEKNGFKNIKVVNHWDGNFQVGSGCLGKDFAANLTAERNDLYAEVTTCCSIDAECKLLKYVELK